MFTIGAATHAATGTPDTTGRANLTPGRPAPKSALASPGVAQVFFGVVVLAGRDRSKSDVGAIPENTQNQFFGELGAVHGAACPGRSEVIQHPHSQRGFFE